MSTLDDILDGDSDDAELSLISALAQAGRARAGLVALYEDEVEEDLSPPAASARSAAASLPRDAAFEYDAPGMRVILLRPAQGLPTVQVVDGIEEGELLLAGQSLPLRRGRRTVILQPFSTPDRLQVRCLGFVHVLRLRP